MKKIILLLLPFIVIGQSEIGLLGFKQETDTVDFNLFDQILINELLLTEIGQAKNNKKANFDTLLYKAAEYHSFYISSKDQCGHFEPEFEFSNSKNDRIEYFISSFDHQALKSGINNNVVETSEICCSFSVHKPISYKELSQKIFNQFKNSPNHWKIILKDMNDKLFYNAACVTYKKNEYGYRVSVVIILNYYNKKYGEDPHSILKSTSEIQKGHWNHSKIAKFNSDSYKRMMVEYRKRKEEY